MYSNAEKILFFYIETRLIDPPFIYAKLEVKLLLKNYIVWKIMFSIYKAPPDLLASLLKNSQFSNIRFGGLLLLLNTTAPPEPLAILKLNIVLLIVRS
jgi:hypothetical protein